MVKVFVLDVYHCNFRLHFFNVCREFQIILCCENFAFQFSKLSSYCQVKTRNLHSILIAAAVSVYKRLINLKDPTEFDAPVSLKHIIVYAFAVFIRLPLSCILVIIGNRSVRKRTKVIRPSAMLSKVLARYVDKLCFISY